MSVSTPLTILADATRDAALASKNTLTQSLAAQDAALPTLLKNVATATTALATDAALEAGLRLDLARIELPSDSDPIVVALENVLVHEQGARAEIEAATDELAAAQLRRARTAADLASAAVAVGVTAQRADQEHAAADQVGAWSTAAAAPAVAAVKAAAQTAKNGDPYQAARSRIQSIVDVSTADTTLYELFARRAAEAAERDADVTATVTRATAAVQHFGAANRPSDATLAGAEAAYATAVADLRDIAENVVARYAAAISALTAMVPPAAAPVPLVPVSPTVAEQGAITAAATDAAAAAPKEVTVYDRRRDLRTKLADLDVKTLAEIEIDPSFDSDTSAVAQAQRQAVTDARTVLATAGQALAGVQEPLDIYEAAIPDSVKDEIVAFFAADRVIDQVAAIDVGALQAAVTAAQTALVGARSGAQKLAASGARLDGELADRRSAADAWTAVSQARRAALIRGEGRPS